METVQKRQRKDRWKHRKIVSTLTYRGKPGVSQVLFDMKQLADALDDYARLMGWSCRLRLDFSMEKRHIHIHCLLEASPGWTAFKWIQVYWFKRHGQVHLDNRELQNPKGYAIYCSRQAVKTIVTTCNWPQSLQVQSPVQVPTLIGKFSKILYSVNCPSSSSVPGSTSNSTTSASVHGCPVPVYDDTCHPYDTLPSLDSLPDEVAAAISTQAECHHGKIIDDDTSQSVAKPVAGITAQCHVTPSSNINDDNSAQMTQTYDVNDRGESRRGGRLRVQANSGGVKGCDDHNPGFKDYVMAIIPVTITSRAGPPRAAPVSVTPAA